jgi:S1-C subfamily serine protease
MYALVVLVLLGADKPKLPAAGDVAAYLQEISVTLKSGYSQGSGTMVIVQVDGKPITFVWTAHHVIAGLRESKEVIAPDGTKRHVVSFKDADIVQEEIENGARVGERKMLARVVTCSEKEDLALLQVRKAAFARQSAVFHTETVVPKVGSDLYHCGSPGGQEIGANSVTPGIVSQIGRRFPEFPGEFDQVSCAALPGSSGGGVFFRNGTYIGMITLGVRGADSFHYIVPIRRIKSWAEKMQVQWALGVGDPPSQTTIDKIAVEDSATLLKPSEKKNSDAAPKRFTVEPLPTAN